MPGTKVSHRFSVGDVVRIKKYENGSYMWGSVKSFDTLADLVRALPELGDSDA